MLSSIASSSLTIELARIPSLIEHFRMHRECDPDLTFFGYLHLHYSPGHFDHLSQHDHTKLPLKGPRSHHAGFKMLALIPGFRESTRIPMMEDYSFYFIESPASAPFADIWQPPRSL